MEQAQWLKIRNAGKFKKYNDTREFSKVQVVPIKIWNS